MCVAVPGRIVAVDHGSGPSRPAQAVFGGSEPKPVDLAMLPDAGVGDYVIVHSGFAIRTLSERAALESLHYFEQTSND